MVDITMIAMAIFGLVGYVILFFGTKEPPHKHEKLIMAIYGVALITMIVAGLSIEWHTVYYWQDLTAFYAIYGFVAFVFLIFTAKGLRPLLQKKEDYYDKRGVEEK